MDSRMENTAQLDSFLSISEVKNMISNRIDHACLQRRIKEKYNSKKQMKNKTTNDLIKGNAGPKVIPGIKRSIEINNN